ncbi:class I SAM-dependent methyltransferase [Methylobacterium sp. CM6257]
MSWELASEIHSVMNLGDPQRALDAIEAQRAKLIEQAWFVAIIEAQCFDQLGNAARGAEILEQQIAKGQSQPWIYYNLGAIYRNIGEKSKAEIAYREAHSLWGWKESKIKGYTFTHDFFAPNITNWTKWFGHYITQKPIRCLEIGSWQGGSATWLLDNVVGPRGGALTCIDTFAGSSEHAPWIDSLGVTIEEIFDRNICASGFEKAVRKIKGFSQDVLMALHNEKFDFCYIDGAHEAKYVLQDAVLCWRLTSSNGFILFDDVDFRFPERPNQDSVHAIDSFVKIFDDDLEVIETGRQLLIRKL